MATRRNRTNGRFTKTTRRRRSPKTTNVSNIAQNLLVINAITKGFLDVNLKTFAGFGSVSQYDNSWEMTATELFSLIFGGTGGMSTEYRAEGGLPVIVKKNLRDNGGMMIAQLIGIPIAFKYGRKLLGKSLIRPANKLLKPAGVRL